MDRAVESRGRGSAAAFFAVVAVVVMVAVICIKTVLSRRKVAKLRSKLRKADERKLQAIEDEEIASCEESRIIAREKMLAAQYDADAMEDGIRRQHEEHLHRVSELRTVADWDDITVVDLRR
jgi:ABC-type transport system involved in cytochrome bd biosynthesis fused ATPase/permease subunit